MHTAVPSLFDRTARKLVHNTVCTLVLVLIGGVRIKRFLQPKSYYNVVIVENASEYVKYSCSASSSCIVADTTGTAVQGQAGKETPTDRREPAWTVERRRRRFKAGYLVAILTINNSGIR